MVISLSKIVDALSKEFADKFKAVPLEDHKFIVGGFLYGDYLTRGGVRQWYDDSGKKLSPEVMSRIRRDEGFFYRESHLADDFPETMISTLPDATFYQNST